MKYIKDKVKYDELDNRVMILQIIKIFELKSEKVKRTDVIGFQYTKNIKYVDVLYATED